MPALTTPTPYPRARLTLNEMVTRVKRDLSLDGSNLLSVADIVEWLNEAQEIWARETRWFKYSLSLSTVADQSEYPFPDSAAAQVLSIEHVRLDDQDLVPLHTQRRLDFAPSNWREQTGTPSHWFLRGMTVIVLWPAPDSASADGLSVYGTGLPPVVSEPEDQCYIPNSYDHALLAYAKWRASEKDAHGEGTRRLGRYEREWEDALRAGKLSVSEADEGAQVFLGSDALYGRGPGWATIPPYTDIGL